MIIDTANRVGEILQIVPLGEGGQLRDIVQAHIHQATDSCFFQLGEEDFGRFFGKANCEKFHCGKVLLAKRGFGFLERWLRPHK